MKMEDAYEYENGMETKKKKNVYHAQEMHRQNEDAGAHMDKWPEEGNRDQLMPIAKIKLSKRAVGITIFIHNGIERERI